MRSWRLVLFKTCTETSPNTALYDPIDTPAIAAYNNALAASIVRLSTLDAPGTCSRVTCSHALGLRRHRHRPRREQCGGTGRGSRISHFARVLLVMWDLPQNRVASWGGCTSSCHLSVTSEMIAALSSRHIIYDTYFLIGCGFAALISARRDLHAVLFQSVRLGHCPALKLADATQRSMTLPGSRVSSFESGGMRYCIYMRNMGL